MLTAGARTEVLAGHQDAAAVSGIVEHKVFIQRPVFVIAPIPEEVVAESLLVGGL